MGGQEHLHERGEGKEEVNLIIVHIVSHKCNLCGNVCVCVCACVCVCV